MKIHIVKKGDTLYFIGQKYNVSIEEIVSLNPGITNPDTLEVGMKIKIPNAQGQNGASGVEIMHQHVVKQGDTLWKLSKAWGVPLAAMVYANPHLKNPNVLLTGEIVNIPKADTVVPPYAMPGKTNTAVKPTGGGANPLHPSSIMQSVQGIVGKLSTAPVIGKKNTAPIMEKTSTAPVSPVPVPAPAPAPKEKEAKVEPLDTGKVEPLATKVEPLDTGKVEPLDTGKVEPLSTGKELPNTSVSPLSTGKELPNTSVSPLSTGKELPNTSVSPLSMGKELPNTSVSPLSMGKELPNTSVSPLSTGKTLPNTSVSPLSTGKTLPNTSVSPLSTGKTLPNTTVAPLSTNNVAPMSTNVSPLSTNNVAPMSTNVSPLGMNNMSPNTTVSPAAVSPTPYASKKALPIEKAIEQKVSPVQSEYMQSMDMNLFQQYNVPATEAIFANPSNPVAPYAANAAMSPYGEMAPMFPYDCPPGTVMMGYPAPALMPYGGAMGYGYPDSGYAGSNDIGAVSPMSNMSNAGTMPYANLNAANAGMMPYSNMNAANTVMMPTSAGMVSPMSGMPTKGLPNTMSTQSIPGYDNGGYPMNYPPYAPYPLWQNNMGATPAPNNTNNDCGCGGKREDEVEAQPAKAGASKATASKPRKKTKKVVIRTVAPRPKKRTTSGSRPWLNR
ncbi:LysM peptidoglycan-binding domain-containing protein [Paenibacillus sp. strain BS8-2]